MFLESRLPPLGCRRRILGKHKTPSCGIARRAPQNTRYPQLALRVGRVPHPVAVSWAVVCYPNFPLSLLPYSPLRTAAGNQIPTYPSQDGGQLQEARFTTAGSSLPSINPRASGGAPPPEASEAGPFAPKREPVGPGGHGGSLLFVRKERHIMSITYHPTRQGASAEEKRTFARGAFARLAPV